MPCMTTRCWKHFLQAASFLWPITSPQLCVLSLVCSSCVLYVNFVIHYRKYLRLSAPPLKLLGWKASVIIEKERNDVEPQEISQVRCRATSSFKMVLETISRIIKIQLPAYLKKLPLPETIGGFARLTGRLNFYLTNVTTKKTSLSAGWSLKLASSWDLRGMPTG